MGRILSPSKNSANHDLVFTPIELAINVIKHFTLSGKVLDPAKGMGAFYDNLPSHVERYWCESFRFDLY